MPKVDFYILKQDRVENARQFICRLVEKVHTLGQRVYIHTRDRNEAELMDDLLWSFKPESFIPHCLVDQDEATETPVLIGCDAPPGLPAGVLINLSPDIPDFHEQFPRIAEVVFNQAEEKKLRREHWKKYESLGCELQSHNV